MAVLASCQERASPKLVTQIVPFTPFTSKSDHPRSNSGQSSKVNAVFINLTASNAIFESNSLDNSLKGKMTLSGNSDAQSHHEVLNVVPRKVEKRESEKKVCALSKANTHSHTAYLKKLSAFTHAELPNANWSNNPLPKKKQVTFSEPPRPSLKPTQKPVVHPKKQTNVCVPMSTGVKPTSGASKTVPNTPRNHSSLPVKSANARRVEAHHRTLNKKNRVDSNLLVKHSVSVSKLNNVCAACNKSLVIANHTDCLSPSNPLANHGANRKPQWKPTGRHFSLFEKYPLTRIMEPTDMPIELPPSASSSPQITMVSRFTDHKLSDRKAGSKGISGSTIVLGYLDSDVQDICPGDPIIACDYKLGDTIISRVYYVEGLKHNLFSVGQFCDGGLEVAFRQHSCHIRNYDMVDLLKGSRTTNLYSISLNDMMSASPVCLLTKASFNEVKAKADIGIFVGYAPTKKAYRIYNKRTRKIQETVHVAFDELTEGLTSVQTSSGLAPQQMTSVPNKPPSVPPTKKQVDDLFQWFDDDEVVLIPPVVPITPVNVPAAPAPENANGSPSTTVISEGAPAVTESLLPHQIPLPDTSDSDVETLFDHVDIMCLNL
ncbi:hypothetical protein Tco_0794901 [Tanacetum coccineum]